MNPIKKHEAFLLFAAGALIALSTTVNTLVAGILTPVISAVTGGKGAYV